MNHLPPPPAAIVHTSSAGLCVSVGTDIEAWHTGPTYIDVSNIYHCTCDEWWCTDDFLQWVWNWHQPSPFTPGLSYVGATSSGRGQTLKSGVTDGHYEVMTFVAINYDGGVQMQSGLWCGPADANLDGLVNSSDVFWFVNSWINHEWAADFNLDGTVDTDDLFDFLGESFW